MAFAGGGKRAVQADVDPSRLTSMKQTGEVAQSHGPGCMGAGGPDHDRADDIDEADG